MPFQETFATFNKDFDVIFGIQPDRLKFLDTFVPRLRDRNRTDRPIFIDGFADRSTIDMPRTTHRSRSGTKLYAKRSQGGQFEDVQTYKRAHGQDVKRSSAAERARKKKGAKTQSSGTRKASKKSTGRQSTKKK